MINFRKFKSSVECGTVTRLTAGENGVGSEKSGMDWAAINEQHCLLQGLG